VTEAGPENEDQLEERLSRPDERVFDALAKCPGDITVLGAGGKMGPSLSRMLQRGVDELGDERRIIAVSRFGGARGMSLAHSGVRGSGRIVTVSLDLTSPADVKTLEPTPNVIFMAGQKFGTTVDPASTWAMNAAVPTLVSDHFRSANIVVFSTGNVYPMTPATGTGSGENDSPAPVGEYATSCLARERIFSWYSGRHDSRLVLLRLNYAVDLRYGVLVDMAQRVLRGDPVDLTMGYVNVIWQGDANAVAIAAMGLCSAPPRILNVTGRKVLSVRFAAEHLGELLGRTPEFRGAEGKDALLSDSSRMCALLGEPRVKDAELMKWVAAWVAVGGRLIAKPTHFEVRDGRF
jgi:nucleoside-diphosphate-sugar epimerase